MVKEGSGQSVPYTEMVRLSIIEERKKYSFGDIYT